VENNKNSNSKAREIFDSLFDQRALAETTQHYFLGNIDSLTNRRLSGWVIDSNDSDATIEFEVFAGSEKVGEGVANTYREDLKKIGYGDGRHGFAVDLNSKIFTGSVASILLREKQTGVLISSNEFTVELESEFVAEVIAIHGRVLHGEIHSSENSKATPECVEVFVDGVTKLPGLMRNIAGDKKLFECQLPADLFDGIPHTYEIIANDSLSSNCHVEILHPITTPEQHLTDSLGSVGYAGLSKNASFRYESLHEHLSQFMADGMVSGVELATLCQAHTEVLRGFSNRKTYSQLKLPRA